MNSASDKGAGRAVVVHNITRASVVASSVLVPSNSRERRHGLLGRASLEPGSGLWISPCEAIHTFGMRFPIDLIFLNRELRALKVQPRVPASRIRVCLAADSVLELAAGAIELSGTRAGDVLKVEAG